MKVSAVGKEGIRKKNMIKGGKTKDEKENHIFIYGSFIWKLPDNRVRRGKD